MLVKVKCFAWAYEVTGSDEIEVEMKESAKVSDLREILSQKFPKFSGRMESIAVSINQEFVGEGAIISSSDEVALIPPISGGL
ncbi:MAG: MoaD/ThiS family protein [Nitrospinota bacterium]|nr:MoaD/ThiS family protein [Nitrospinota bacterium]